MFVTPRQFKFFALPPQDPVERARLERRVDAAGRYSDALIKLERDKFFAVRDAYMTDPGYRALVEAKDAVYARLDSFYESLNQRRAAARKKIDFTQEEKKAISAIKAEGAEAWKMISAHRKVTSKRKGVKALIAKAEKALEAACEIAAATAQREGVSSTCRTAIENAVEQAVKDRAAIGKPPIVKNEESRYDSLSFQVKGDRMDQTDFLSETKRGWVKLLRPDPKAFASSGCAPPAPAARTDGFRNAKEAHAFKRKQQAKERALLSRADLEKDRAARRVKLEEIRAARVEDKGRAAHQRTNLLVRVNDDVSKAGARRDSEWARMEVLMHRELPPGRVTGVRILREKIQRGLAEEAKWSVCVTVESPFENIRKATGTKTAAINLGWRVLPTKDVRVATVVDEDGDRMELILTAELVAHYYYLDNGDPEQEDGPTPKIGPTRGRAANLASGIALLAKAKEALGQSTVGVYGIRRPDAVHDFIEAHIDLLPPRMQRQMREWQKQDRHLRDWALQGRRKCLDKRLQIYRAFAMECAKRFAQIGTVAIPEDLGPKKKGTASPASGNEFSALNRLKRFAAPGEIIQVLKSAGLLVTQFTKEQSRAGCFTKRCHICKDICAFDAKTALEHTCEHCGATWDQDTNHAKNACAALLALRSTARALAYYKTEEIKPISARRAGRMRGKAIAEAKRSKLSA